MEQLLKLLKSIKPDTDFRASRNLLGEGLLDLLDIVNIVSAIEKEYMIEIEPDEIDPDNFQSVESILNMITMKRSLGSND